MALSLASVLHYWSARFGPVPIVGGKPSHARNSAATVTDQRGVVYPAIVNTPRMPWRTIVGERRQAMLLELARTNLWTQSQFVSGWTPAQTTLIQAATPAPDGTMTGVHLKEDTSVTNNHYVGGPTATIVNGSVYTVSVYAKAKERTWLVVQGSQSSFLGGYQYFDIGNGVVGALGSGITSRKIEALGGGWYRCSLTATATGTTAIPFIGLATGDGGRVYSGDGASGAYVWGAQIELSPFVTAYIPTTTTVATRSADSFYWDYAMKPQAMVGYARFIERGTATIGGAAVLRIGAAGTTNPLLLLYSAGFYRVYHETGAGNRISTLAVAPVIGDLVELVFVLFADGSVSVSQSINGAAVTAAAQSAPLALGAAWGGSTLRLLEWNSDVGAAEYAEIKLVRAADVVGVTAQAQMDELRAFELTPAGEVL